MGRHFTLPAPLHSAEPFYHNPNLKILETMNTVNASKNPQVERRIREFLAALNSSGTRNCFRTD